MGQMTRNRTIGFALALLIFVADQAMKAWVVEGLGIDAPGKAIGAPEHPHRGFETVTIVYQGELEHRDSTGSGGKIGPGDVQWMTAAKGILHEEFHSADFAKSGGTLEMVQLWVNLPAKDKMAAPGYQTILDGDIPNIALKDDAGHLRLIAGEFGGQRGPAQTLGLRNEIRWFSAMMAMIGKASINAPGKPPLPEYGEEPTHSGAAVVGAMPR